MAALTASEEGLMLRVLDIERGTSVTLANVAQPKGTDIDVVGLVNTISWVP